MFSKGQCSLLRTCSEHLFYNLGNHFDEKKRKLSEIHACKTVSSELPFVVFEDHSHGLGVVQSAFRKLEPKTVFLSKCSWSQCQRSL